MEIERMVEEYMPREDKIEQAIDYLRDEVMGMTKGDPEKRLVLLGYLTQIGRLISERHTWG
jgi:hypothetical protein